MMWQFVVFTWLGILAVVAIMVQRAFGYDFARISALYSALPPNQRLATGAVALLAISLIGATIWLTGRTSRQEKQLTSLRDRLKGTRQDIVVAHALQNHFDAAIEHLVNTDAEEAISQLQKKLEDSEQQALSQASRTEATDITDQLSDIRRRQQELREKIGGVAEKRRAIEPVFAEIRDRQRQLERSLTELEADDNKYSVALRLKELDQDVSVIDKRKNVLQESFEKLTRFKDQMGQSQAELVPLRAPEGGINALIAELRVGHDQLAKSLAELESDGAEPLGSRVEALSKSKIEIEQQVARVDDEFNILNAIRLDFAELGKRQAYMELALAEVETDSSGKSLTDRRNALNEFIIESRLRLRTLQDTFTTLHQFKSELAKSQADLLPLQAPVFGIEALIGEAHATRDLLSKTLAEIELSGDQKLASRVEALSRSKREIEERLALVFDNFTTLDALRKDIGGIFTTIRNTLNRIG